MNHKIIISTTFREFDGSENSKMQIAFLKSLRKQTYGNFILAVSVYGEKTVKDVVGRYLGERAVFRDSDASPFKFSNTKTLFFGIDIAKQYPESITAWTTSDIILDDNYLEEVNGLYTDDSVTVTHPNHIAECLDDFVSGKIVLDNPCEGIDVLFFSTKLLMQDDIMSLLNKYHFDGYGEWELFLTSLIQYRSKHKYNICGISNVFKIKNEEKRGDNENKYWVSMNVGEMRRARKIFYRYFDEEGIKDDRTTNLAFCHFVYKPLDKRMYKNYIFFWFQRVFPKEKLVWWNRLPIKISRIFLFDHCVRKKR